jgi:lipopolysaccharide transport system permease protein
MDPPVSSVVPKSDRQAVATGPPAHTASLTIQPPGSWHAVDLRELWRYRELIYFLLWRDLKVRYKQTAIGAAWAVLQPLLTVVVFSVVFGRLVSVPSEGVPYPVFSYSALVPWTFFATAVTRAGSSLIQDPNLISKVYFPRLVMPLAAVSALLLDFAIAFAVLIGLMLFYGLHPGPAALALPLLLVLVYVTALGIGLWVSAANVKYRDINYVIPFLTQFLLFLSPVVYPTALVPDAWLPVYSLNPMVGVIEGFRWALLGTPIDTTSILVSTVSAVVLCACGLLYFRRMEREFADVV